jgi:hypothetical protein
MAQSTAAPMLGFSNANALSALGVTPTGGQTPLEAQMAGAGGAGGVQGLLASLLGGAGAQQSPQTPQPTMGQPVAAPAAKYAPPDTTWGLPGDRLLRYTPESGPVDPGLMPKNPFAPVKSPQPGTPKPIVGSGNPDSGFGPIVPPELNQGNKATTTAPPWGTSNLLNPNSGLPWNTPKETGAARAVPVDQYKVYTSNGDLSDNEAVTGKVAPNLVGFTDAELYRNIGNNPGLSADLVARDGYDAFRQKVNMYNTGSGFENQADFKANNDAQFAVRSELAKRYNLPFDPNQGLTKLGG